MTKQWTQKPVNIVITIPKVVLALHMTEQAIIKIHLDVKIMFH